MEQLTKRQAEVMMVISEHMAKTKRPPSLREIAGVLQININAVSHHLKALERKGRIRRAGGSLSRSIEIVNPKCCPFCGRDL